MSNTLPRVNRKGYFFNVPAGSDASIKAIIYEAVSFLGEDDSAWRFGVRRVGYLEKDNTIRYDEATDINGDPVVQSHSIRKHVHVGWSYAGNPEEGRPGRMLVEELVPNKTPTFLEPLRRQAWKNERDYSPYSWADLKLEFSDLFNRIPYNGEEE